MTSCSGQRSTTRHERWPLSLLVAIQISVTLLWLTLAMLATIRDWLSERRNQAPPPARRSVPLQRPH